MDVDRRRRNVARIADGCIAMWPKAKHAWDIQAVGYGSVGRWVGSLGSNANCAQGCGVMLQKEKKGRRREKQAGSRTVVQTRPALAAGPAIEKGVALARALVVLLEAWQQVWQAHMTQADNLRQWASCVARSLSPELTAAEAQQGEKRSRWVDDAHFSPYGCGDAFGTRTRTTVPSRTF